MAITTRTEKKPENVRMKSFHEIATVNSGNRKAAVTHDVAGRRAQVNGDRPAAHRTGPDFTLRSAGHEVARVPSLRTVNSSGKYLLSFFSQIRK